MKIKFFEDFFKVEVLSEHSHFTEVSTDTRSLKPGALFVALKGENFDGNQFVEEAFKKGALAALISDPQATLKNKTCVMAEDSLLAFQDLAQAWQRLVAPKKIAITGSNGKTTTKFFMAQALEPFFKICFSPKSYNNEFGVPMTQALLKEGDEVLIAEVGTNAPGEIAHLRKMVKPDLALVTTVGPSHLEGFGTVENVAKEKQSLYEGVLQGLFNLDNFWTKKMYGEFKGEKLTFSAQDSSADVFLKAKQQDISQLDVEGHVLGAPVRKTLNLFGEHNVYNIMAALGGAQFLGMTAEQVEQVWPLFQTPWGRTQTYQTPAGFSILFDAYNANLQSMEALFASLQKLHSPHLNLVLGEMLELGDQSDQMHLELGRKAAALGLKFFMFLGPSFKQVREGWERAGGHKNSVFTGTYEQSLAIDLENMLETKDWLVLKGSRGARLERFLDFFKAEPQTQN